MNNKITTLAAVICLFFMICAIITLKPVWAILFLLMYYMFNEEEK